jgi:putative transposase
VAERIHRQRYLTLADARADVFDYIERFHRPRMQPRIDARNQAFTALTHCPRKRVELLQASPFQTRALPSSTQTHPAHQDQAIARRCAGRTFDLNRVA